MLVIEGIQCITTDVACCTRARCYISTWVWCKFTGLTRRSWAPLWMIVNLIWTSGAGHSITTKLHFCGLFDYNVALAVFKWICIDDVMSSTGKAGEERLFGWQRTRSCTCKLRTSMISCQVFYFAEMPDCTRVLPKPFAPCSLCR